jgi:hypothetical protein
MEDQDRLALLGCVLARARFRRVVDSQQRLLDVGHLGEIDRIGDVPSFELIVEAAVDDEEALDP